MKKVFCFVIIFAALLTGGAYASPAPPELAAPSAALMEKVTGELLYEKNAHERLFPASVTKIMTMLLIAEDIEAGVLSLDDTVVASARAASFGGSCVFLEEGERMSVSDMLKCIAVVSANDCAVAMAEHLSGTEERFVVRMNERAAALALEDTHFTNCSGLFDDGEHYTSAYDVAVMSRELIRHELIKEYTTIWMDSIRNGEFELSNTNKLVYWYPGCTGLKTGYTSTSLYCLSATAERDGTEYIAVVMRGASVDSRNEDAKALLNYAFNSYSLFDIGAAAKLPEVGVELGTEKSVAVEYKGGSSLLLPKSAGEVKCDLEMQSSVMAPVKAGDRLGTLKVTQTGQEPLEVAVCAAQNVPRLGFWGFFSMLAGSLFGL